MKRRITRRWSALGMESEDSGSGHQSSAHRTCALTAEARGLKYTSEELQRRTPRTIFEALNGPDAVFWAPSIVRDFDILREMKCVKQVTSEKPPGKAPPAVEQRFRNKYKGHAITLQDIPERDWKSRTVVRGDRFRYGEHYHAKEAPTVQMPAVKMFLDWAVQLGLMLFQFDQVAAFYGNPMDVEGVWVRLPPGFDPTSKRIRDLHAPPLFGVMAAALPGCPQGSRQQYLAMRRAFEKIQFKSIEGDGCLFLSRWPWPWHSSRSHDGTC